MFKKYHPQIINILTQETLWFPFLIRLPAAFRRGRLHPSHSACESASEAWNSSVGLIVLSHLELAMTVLQLRSLTVLLRGHTLLRTNRPVLDLQKKTMLTSFSHFTGSADNPSKASERERVEDSPPAFPWNNDFFLQHSTLYCIPTPLDTERWVEREKKICVSIPVAFHFL